MNHANSKQALTAVIYIDESPMLPTARAIGGELEIIQTEWNARNLPHNRINLRGFWVEWFPGCLHNVLMQVDVSVRVWIMEGRQILETEPQPPLGLIDILNRYEADIDWALRIHGLETL